MEHRFITAEDTPCPFRLGRFGYAQTGEFRAPVNGELYIQPSDGPEIQEHEPVITGACQDFPADDKRHIVKALSERTQQEIENLGPFFLFLGSQEAFDELNSIVVEQEESA